MAEPRYENAIELFGAPPDRRVLIFYLQYVLPEVAAISSVSASLLSSAIAHLEDCGQPLEPVRQTHS